LNNPEKAKFSELKQDKFPKHSPICENDDDDDDEDRANESQASAVWVCWDEAGVSVGGEPVCQKSDRNLKILYTFSYAVP